MKRRTRNQYCFRINMSRKQYKAFMAGWQYPKRPRILSKIKRKWQAVAGEPVTITLTWAMSQE